MSETSSLPANTDSVPAIGQSSGIKCPHCGQAYTDAGINIAIFLYGIFFLVGKESGYFGITCPRCLKTISHRNKKEAIWALKQVLTGMVDFGVSVFDPKLRYYSSLNGSPKDIPLIGAFKVPYINHELRKNEPPTFSEIVRAYLEDNPDLEKGFLCSYVHDGNEPSGNICHAWWIHEADVEKLIQIENIKGIKIFPRYYHHCELLEDVDRFCWKYGYTNIYLENLKNRIARNREKLEQELILQGVDLKDAIEATPGMIDPSMIESIQSETQKHNASEILTVSGDFLKILIADPYPWGIEGSIGTLCKGFWKTKHPFRSIALPISLTKFSPHPFQEAAESLWCQQAKSDILPEITKSYIQTYLMENYASFIREYAEIIHNRSFCYADLWILKEKYLKELHALVKEQKKVQNKNLFYQQNGFWVVSYNGNESIIQNLDGMTYIHFLLQHKGKKSTYFDIEKLLNGEVAKDDGEDKEVHIESEIIDREFIFSLTPQEMITKEFLDEILREREKVSGKLRKSEKNGDKNEYTELNSCLEKIDSFLKDSTYKSKKGKKTKIKIKKFKDSKVYKVKKDNVDRVLNYALFSLEEHNEEAYKHLEASIKNKRGELWYEPAVDTDWYTG